MNIPTCDKLIERLVADPQAGLPVDFSAQPWDPADEYWHVYERGREQLGHYASEAAAVLAVAEQVYGGADELAERYRHEPAWASAQVQTEYRRNVPAFAAEFEVRRCQCRYDGAES